MLKLRTSLRPLTRIRIASASLAQCPQGFLSIRQKSSLNNERITVPPFFHSGESEMIGIPTHKHSNNLQDLDLSLPINKEKVLAELNRLLSINELEDFHQLFTKVTTHSKSLSSLAIDEDSEPWNKLTQLSLHWNNSTIPSILLLESNNRDIDPKTIHAILQLLFLKNPVLEDLQLNMIYRLLSKYPKVVISEFEVSQILEKLRNYSKLKVTKEMLQLLMERQQGANMTAPTKTHILYELIKIDRKLSNPAGCYMSLVKLMKLQPLNEIDPRVIAMLLSTFNKNHKFKSISAHIVSKLTDLTNPLTLDAVLRSLIHSRETTKLNTIMNTLTKNINKTNLSHLLRINLTFANYNNVELIIQRLISQYRLESHDYLAIIRSLLNKKNFKEALNFSQSIPIPMASGSYLAIIDNIVTARSRAVMNNRNLAIIDELCNKMKTAAEKEKADIQEFWGALTPIYFKYLLKSTYDCESLETLIKIYELSTKEFLLPLTTQYNPFQIEKHDEFTKLRILDNSKTVIIKSILDKAIYLKSTKWINWASLNLLELGFSPKELKFDVYRKLDSRLQEMKDLESTGLNGKKWKRKFLEKREFMKER